MTSSCRQRDRSLFRLVADSHVTVGIDLGAKRIDHSQCLKILRFDNSKPAKRTPPVGIGRDADGIGAFVNAGLKRVECAAMLVITKPPKSHHSNQRQSSAKPASASSATDSNSPVDQGEGC